MSIKTFITEYVNTRAARVKAHLHSINPEAVLIEGADLALLGVSDRKAVYHGDILDSMNITSEENVIKYHPSSVSLDDLFLSTIFGLSEDAQTKAEIISVISELSASLGDYSDDAPLSVIALQSRISSLLKALMHLSALSDFDMVSV